jgi:uncharacterized caspase-like protein
MRAVAAIVLAVWSSWLFSQPAFAEKRVALVLGNSAYQKVNPLVNPANDSAAIATTFKNAGFDVVELKRDLNVNEMRRALRDFAGTAHDADVAIVYYAGHGIEIDGTNYLIPVDAVLEHDIDAYDEAVPLDRILTVIEPAKQLRLVILDACRDNPFNKTMKRTIGTRAIGRGLAKVDPASPNTLIAFAAKAGSTASDGDSQNSPFTAALVKYLPRPGLDLRKAFGFARDEVLKVTNNRQEPFIYGSLGGNDVALVPGVVAPSPAASVADPNAGARRDYEFALQIATRPVWDSFISNYPSGFYTELARAQRDKLAAEAARVAATETARRAADEQARLAAVGAKSSELAKAAEQTKAAEQARVAAEKTKAAEDSKVAEAERAKAAAQTKAAEAESVAPASGDGGRPTASARPLDQAALVPGLSQPVAAAPISDPSMLREIRERLYELNFDPGPLEGKFGEPARKSIREFEAGNGIAPTGEPTDELLRQLRNAGELKPWGALVYSRKTGKWGGSWAQASRTLAVAKARVSCGDSTVCDVELSFFGTACGSFAHAEGGFSIIARRDVKTAREAALADCGKRGKSCSTVASVCADGTGLLSAADK